MAVWEEIVDYTVPSNTTSITFNNFGTITKDDFVKVVLSVPPVSATNFNFFVNGNNNTSNYSEQYINAYGTTIGAGRVDGPEIHRTGLMETWSISYIKISENGYYHLFSNIQNGNTNPDLILTYHYSNSEFALTNSQITQFDLVAEISNNIVAGSRIQIYRLAAEKVADITVASNTTQVDITGLNIDKGSEYLLVSDCLNPNSAIGIGYEQNTTITDYYKQRIGGSGSSPYVNRFNDAYYMVSLTLNAVGYQHIKISNTGSFTTQSYFIRDAGGSSLIAQNSFISSIAENITNINELNIYSSVSGGLKANSRFQLYKLY